MNERMVQVSYSILLKINEATHGQPFFGIYACRCGIEYAKFGVQKAKNDIEQFDGKIRTY